MNTELEPCRTCNGKGGWEESACGEGCCRAGVMCEACQGTGYRRAAQPVSAGLTDEQILATFEAAGVKFFEFYSIREKAPVKATSGSQDAKKLVEAARALLSAAQRDSQPVSSSATRKLVEQCRDALAVELEEWDIDPPLQHVKNAHDACVAWLAEADSQSVADTSADARDAAVRFAGMVFAAHRNDGYPSDLDGGELQDMALQSGLIERRVMREPCGDTCTCAEVADFPTECFFNTDAGRAAIAASREGK